MRSSMLMFIGIPPEVITPVPPVPTTELNPWNSGNEPAVFLKDYFMVMEDIFTSVFKNK